ncbi:MAG: S1 RNA-binding domain-containing protein [Candidatus Gracilibacteria bacterium]|nr:S1 RNA-binding domain-containing protein [Candidatus Gracilibacteria bacterium]
MSDNSAMDAAVQAAEQTKFPQLGELISGKILSLHKNRCLLDLCDGQAVGMISGRETHDTAGTFKTLGVGDDVNAVVVEDENDEGFFVLSLRKAAQNTAWDRFEDSFENGTMFGVKVTEANKGGLLLEMDSIKAFLPVSQLAPMHYPRVNEANSQEILRRLQRLIGLKFDVKIIALDRENGKLILSERAAQADGRKERLAKLTIGDSVKGKISGIVKFGLFVAFEGLEGLVHISEIAWGHVRNPADYGKLGDDVEVMIIGIDGEKISLSIKRLQQDPWKEAASKFSIGERITGKINRITTFGAFVTLDKDINGLIHLSEISHDKVEDIEKFIRVGQEVDAEIINVDLDDHRIGLSIKKLTPAPEVQEVEEMVEEAPAETEPVEEAAEAAPAEAKEEASVEETKTEGGEDLTALDGVSEKIAAHLVESGLDTVEKIKAASLDELKAVDGVGEKTAQKIHDGVQ